MGVGPRIFVFDERLLFNSSLLTNRLGIKPFYLFIDVKEPHLDPVFALLEWIHVSQIKQGYLFRRINANDQVVLENQHLVSRYVRYKRIVL